MRRWRAILAGLAGAWFELTAREQQAVLLVLGLALLGLAVRAWQPGERPAAPPPPAPPPAATAAP